MTGFWLLFPEKFLLNHAESQAEFDADCVGSIGGLCGGAVDGERRDRLDQQGLCSKSSSGLRFDKVNSGRKRFFSEKSPFLFFSLLSVCANTPKTFDKEPKLLYITMATDAFITVLYTAEMIAKIRGKGLLNVRFFSMI
jgi:hypothetical protein